jgi:hypothetical protein
MKAPAHNRLRGRQSCSGEKQAKPGMCLTQVIGFGGGLVGRSPETGPWTGVPFWVGRPRPASESGGRGLRAGESAWRFRRPRPRPAKLALQNSANTPRLLQLSLRLEW